MKVRVESSQLTPKEEEPLPLSGVTDYPDGVLLGLSSHLHVFSVLQLHPRDESGQNPLPPALFTVLPKGVWEKEAKDFS